MENKFFLNAGFEPSMPTWQSLSSAMEIQPTTLLNCSSDQNQDCFFNPNWEKSTDQQNLHFDSSALSSIVSSPISSSPPNENFMMRELIGKLGTFRNSCDEISQHFVKENMQNMNSSVDLGFVERAAKFSCFGSKSFNERSNNQFVMKNNNVEFVQRSVKVMENGKILPRVSSSPSLKTLVSQINNIENKNENGRMEVANSQEESTISEQNTPNGEMGVKVSLDIMNSRKRKASSSKGKASNSSSPKKVKLQFFKNLIYIQRHHLCVFFLDY